MDRTLIGTRWISLIEFSENSLASVRWRKHPPMDCSLGSRVRRFQMEEME